jgi:potassium-transporting ATPase KdpC subunit
MDQLKPAIIVLVLLSLVTGVAYPLIVTGVAQVIFPKQANGSLILRDGKPVGSSLIGQPFDEPKYFWGRLSATSPFAYNAGASAGSNYGPLNPAFHEAAKARIAALREADPDNTAPIPVDLVTASGSGLDPDISPAAAFYQVTRVAKARGVDAAQVRRLVEQHIESRQLGALGEPRVNVLRLNLALDGVPQGAQ